MELDENGDDAVAVLRHRHWQSSRYIFHEKLQKEKVALKVLKNFFRIYYFIKSVLRCIESFFPMNSLILFFKILLYSSMQQQTLTAFEPYLGLFTEPNLKTIFCY